MAFVALKCPNCGGRLEVTKEMSTFACGYCGASVTVQRRGGTVSLSLEEAIARVQVGTDKTAAELAIRRLREEVQEKLNWYSDSFLPEMQKRKARCDAMERANSQGGAILGVLLLLGFGVVGLFSGADAAFTIGAFVAAVIVFVFVRQKQGVLNEVREAREAINTEIKATCDRTQAEIDALRARIEEKRALADS